jgi:hypothetical protein
MLPEPIGFGAASRGSTSEREMWLAHAMATRRNRLWGFDDADRAMLTAATAELPSLRALVARAEPRADLRLWLVRASKRELMEMYELVEALMDGTRSRGRLDQLEGLLASLCTAVDGF